jgi:hypothetical protein
MPLPLITVQTFNQSSLQAAGAVFVQRVESVSVSRGLLAGITGAPSGTGRNELMEKKMNDLTQVLLSELDIQAKKKYPAAIGLVNADIDFTISGQDASMMLIGKASATVLVKRTKPLVSSGTMPEPMSRPMSEPAAMPMSAPMPRPMSEPMPMSAPMPRFDPMSRPMSEPRLDPMKGGKQRTFISKRLIKSSRKNRK